MKKLVVFIPAFNEADTIRDVIGSIPASITGFDDLCIVVVDDGSTDNTGKLAVAAGAVVVSHRRNLGLAEAFRTGIRSCLEQGAGVAVSIDADLQFQPSDIPFLTEPILSGEADFVAATRFRDNLRPKHMPWIKYHGNRLMTAWVNTLTGESFSDVSSGYRAYSREALLNINVQSSFTYTQETFIELAAKGFSITQIPVSVTYFPERQSRVVTSVIRYALRTFLTIARTTRDYAPLTIFGWMSAILIVPGILLGVFILLHYIWFGSFTPYIFLAFMAVYLFTFGAGLLVLSLVADMLRGTRVNQERLLYFSKVHHYKTYEKNFSEINTRTRLHD